MYHIHLTRAREESCNSLPLRLRRCSSTISQVQVSPLARGDALRWAQFLSDEKLGKESPKAGPSPALWNPPRGTGCPCVLLVSALGLVGSHRRRGNSTESACSSVWSPFYSQGLTLVSRCSQRPEIWLPAAGTPLGQDRPGRGNCLAIGPAAQGNLVWWQRQRPQQG